MSGCRSRTCLQTGQKLQNNNESEAGTGGGNKYTAAKKTPYSEHKHTVTRLHT